MSKILTIGGKNYTVEFSIEASLYNDCINSTISLMADTLSAETEQDVKKLVSSIANVPQTTITLLYAGLLENHSDAIEGTKDAKELVKAYLKENKGTDKGSYYALLGELLDCMRDDGFFDLIGLTEMLTQTEDGAEQKATEIKKSGKK